MFNDPFDLGLTKSTGQVDRMSLSRSSGVVSDDDSARLGRGGFNRELHIIASRELDVTQRPNLRRKSNLY